MNILNVNKPTLITVSIKLLNVNDERDNTIDTYILEKNYEFDREVFNETFNYKLDDATYNYIIELHKKLQHLQALEITPMFMNYGYSIEELREQDRKRAEKILGN